MKISKGLGESERSLRRRKESINAHKDDTSFNNTRPHTIEMQRCASQCSVHFYMHCIITLLKLNRNRKCKFIVSLTNEMSLLVTTVTLN